MPFSPEVIERFIIMICKWLSSKPNIINYKVSMCCQTCIELGRVGSTAGFSPWILPWAVSTWKGRFETSEVFSGAVELCTTTSFIFYVTNATTFVSCFTNCDQLFCVLWIRLISTSCFMSPLQYLAVLACLWTSWRPLPTPRNKSCATSNLSAMLTTSPCQGAEETNGTQQNE